MAKGQKKHQVVGIGEILWDILPTGKQLGGAPANFAYHCQSLGANSYVVSAVGNDKLGEEIISYLDNIHLNRDYIHRDQKFPTGTVDVKVDEKGKPNFTIHTNVAWDYIPFSQKMHDLAKNTSAVCYGTLAQRSEISRNTIRNFIAATPPECFRVFDINLRQSFYHAEIIQENLLLSNCLKLNEDELPVLANLFSYKGLEKDILLLLLKEFQLDIIALTKGEAGSLLFTQEHSTFFQAPSVLVADTVGAGDAFTAALTMGLLYNQPLEQIHKNATSLAAYVCTKKGATPLLRKDLKHKIFNFA